MARVVFGLLILLGATDALGEQAFSCTPALDFGPVPVGLSRTMTVSCTNRQSVPLRFRYGIDFVGAFGWSPSHTGVCLGVPGLCFYDLDLVQAGKSFLIQVTFRPRGLGPHSSAVTIGNNAGLEPVTIPFSGVGVTPSTIPLYGLSTSPRTPLLQIDPGTGATRTLVVTGAPSASLPTVDREGKRLFFWSGAPGSQSLYRVDLERLTVSQRPIGRLESYLTFHYDPGSRTILALTSDAGASLVAIDPDSGAINTLAMTGALAPTVAALDRYGRRFFFMSGGVGAQVLLTIDLDTGRVMNASSPNPQAYRSLEYDARSRMLLAITEGGHGAMFGVDPMTGISTIRQETGLVNVSSVAFDPIEGRQFALSNESASQRVVTLPLESGVAEAYATLDESISGLAYGSASPAGCFPDGLTLCLDEARFRVRIRWNTSSTYGFGDALALTANAGAFWFFTANNIEIAIKVVDGRAVNGRFWVFGAALTDVVYDLEILDTATGVAWIRHQPAGRLESFADTAAF